MWQKSVTRREAAELFSERSVPNYTDISESETWPVYWKHSEEMYAIWQYDPRISRSIPSILVVAADEHVELLAWFASYVPNARPLTANCRLVDGDTVNEYLTLKAPSIGNFQNAVTGIILAELATLLNGKRAFLDSSVTACKATLSFCIARAITLGLSNEAVLELPSRWQRSRSLLNLPQSLEQMGSVLRVWSVLASLHSPSNSYIKPSTFPQFVTPNNSIQDACQTIIQGDDLRPSVWAQLFDDRLDVRAMVSELKGPREGRVVLLEAALKYVEEHPPRNAEVAGFLVAYLANSVSPGTLDHIQLVIPLLRIFPDVVLWYGLLAGLMSDGSLGKTADDLARRISRELFRDNDFLGSPTCDIGLQELALLSSSSRGWQSIRENIPGLLSVELMPSIDAVHRIGKEAEYTAEPAMPNIDLIRDLDRQVKQLTILAEKMKASIGVSESVQNNQGDKRRKASKGNQYFL